MQILGLFVLLIMAFLGTPLFVMMGAFALFLFYFAGTDSVTIMIELYRLSSSPTLLSIPLFTLTGYLIAESKAPERIFRVARMMLGWIPRGVSIVALIVCAFFTAFTGASGVTIIAMGGILYPILMKEGHSEKFTMGLITTSGSLGLLFPPSLPLIIYGIIAKVDIDQLFLAGIIPGFLLLLLLIIYSFFQTSKSSDESAQKIAKEPFRFDDLIKSIWEAKYELPLPLIVLASIYSGFATVTETATITLIYIFIVEVIILKDISIKKKLPHIIKESMSLVGAILLILCCALGVTNYLVDEEIPQTLFQVLKPYITNKVLFLILLNLFLLVVGALMDIFSAIIVVVPLILPLAMEFDINPIHLAIIFLTNLEIGYLTPPVGINLFISSFRFKKDIIYLYRASFPFLVVLLIGLIILTFVPELSLFLIKDTNGL